MTLYPRFAAHLDAALDALTTAGMLPAGLSRANVTVEPPRDASHGDLATNAAMVLAKPAGTNPRALAQAIAAELDKLTEVAGVTVAGPGFINLTLTDPTWRDELRAIHAAGDDFGRSTGARASPSTSNMSPPIRPGRCTWAIAGGPWLAMRWPACSNSAGIA